MKFTWNWKCNYKYFASPYIQAGQRFIKSVHTWSLSNNLKASWTSVSIRADNFLLFPNKLVLRLRLPWSTAKESPFTDNIFCFLLLVLCWWYHFLLPHHFEGARFLYLFLYSVFGCSCSMSSWFLILYSVFGQKVYAKTVDGRRKKDRRLKGEREVGESEKK